ncbi:MAG TPA: alpha/beta hydrolase [Marmoricola sp.]|nr:alpha/beta hydrolase [Marmoricola sp.]
MVPPRLRDPARDGAGVLEAAALAAEHAESLVLSGARDIHGSIAGRVHHVLDRVSGGPTVSRRAHDGIAAAVYGGIGLGLRAAARGLHAADKAGLGPPIERSARGRFVVSAVNGLIGDRLVADASPLAIEMGLRLDGRDVPVDTDALAAAYPDAGGALVVFLHGLCETEHYWDRRSRPRHDDGTRVPPYGARLAADEGWTPLYVRANTGLPIAESGVALSAMLTRLVDAWPVEVRRIALVGHSMGGLVIRAACAVSTSADRDWTKHVTDVVLLGAPNLGSPVERTIARGVRMFHRVPELSPFARVFDQRSVGVLDLHDGPSDEIAHVPHARYHLVAATLTRSARHPLAGTVGDLLVPYRSAAGLLPNGEEIFPGADVLHVPGADHFDLLNHEDVYTALRDWLADRSRADTRGTA